jgi:hypothetical protein
MNGWWISMSLGMTFFIFGFQPGAPSPREAWAGFVAKMRTAEARFSPSVSASSSQDTKREK